MTRVIKKTHEMLVVTVTALAIGYLSSMIVWRDDKTQVSGGYDDIRRIENLIRMMYIHEITE